MPPVASNAPATGDVDRSARPHTQDSAHAPNPDQTGTTQPTEPTISPPATGRSTINADVIARMALLGYAGRLQGQLTSLALVE